MLDAQSAVTQRSSRIGTTSRRQQQLQHYDHQRRFQNHQRCRSALTQPRDYRLRISAQQIVEFVSSFVSTIHLEAGLHHQHR